MSDNAKQQPEQQDELMAINARFRSYPEPSADGETETIIVREVALGMTPCVLIEANIEEEEPTFTIHMSAIPSDVVASILRSFGEQLGANIEAHAGDGAQ